METLLQSVIVHYVLPLGGSIVIIVIFFLYIAFYPEKIEKISSWILKFLSLLPKVFTFAKKKYIKHDLQSRVNDFARSLRKEAPGVATEKLRVEWVPKQTDRKSFIADGNIVIRLRENDPQDHNFVHGAFLYVSTALLQKPKRYLSVAQRESLDLFVCSELIESEKPHVRGFYVDNYLFPKTKDKKSKINEYLDDFGAIHEGKLFYPIFLQELEYLGEKVFGRRQDEEIRKEVNELIKFLKPIALRHIGDEGDLEYQGSYCRFGIMFVGKPTKLVTSMEPYKHYFKRHFIDCPTETVYLLGRAENQDKLNDLATAFSSEYVIARAAHFRKRLMYDNGSSRNVSQYLLILHHKGDRLIRSSSDRPQFQQTTTVTSGLENSSNELN